MSPTSSVEAAAAAVGSVNLRTQHPVQHLRGCGLFGEDTFNSGSLAKTLSIRQQVVDVEIPRVFGRRGTTRNEKMNSIARPDKIRAVSSGSTCRETVPVDLQLPMASHICTSRKTVPFCVPWCGFNSLCVCKREPAGIETRPTWVPSLLTSCQNTVLWACVRTEEKETQ